MYRIYSDILNRIPDDPIWWDENAVPRYNEFSPDLCDIYATEVVLMEISCQGCGHLFKVAMSRSTHDDEWAEFPPHYGDPPNNHCCDEGPMMNSEHVRIIGHWKDNGRGEWELVAE